MVSARISRMSRLSRKLVLGTALLVMPLQGIAATLPVLLCHGEVQTHVMHADTSGHHAAYGYNRPNDGGTGGNPAYYPCCHNIVYATPCAASLAVTLESPVRAFAPDDVHDLFCPDRPDRPPLA